ncbi:MAG: type I DNA topoisomerase [Nitrospirales bacterium]|nr:type I DNA topoisomerase [Nitrospirales bacterium]
MPSYSVGVGTSSGIEEETVKALVIVESPAKAKTINKILGKDFGVKASVGHVKDLPEKELGVDVENDFALRYVIVPGKEKVLKELKAEARKSDMVYLATDPDREGEAIAFHIADEIRTQKNKGKIFRVTFHEITERAVREAIKSPSDIDIHKVHAQQARRVLDRLVGYNLSPFLWKKVRRGLSAGRVQSVAVRLVVEREREIEAFQKEEYWTIETVLLPQGGAAPTSFNARLYKYNGSLIVDRDAAEGKRFLITSSGQAQEVIDRIRDKAFFLLRIDKKMRKRAPSPPFTTSTIQQEAARRLRFPAKKTMMIAQQLYEGIELGAEGSVGLITYMRTDSFRIAPEAQVWAREIVTARFGKDYIPEKPPQYKSKGSAQEAHEAIRPTYPDKTPESVKPFLSRDQFSLYSLIWNRFLASQMAPAQLEQTTFIIGLRDNGTEIEGTELRTTGTVIRFQGFMALYTEGKDEIEEEEGGLLPALKGGEDLSIEEIKPDQHFTQPPPRYTEATLVKTLEEKGIGRPSTYAAILSTIQDRKYAEKNDDRRFEPTELGMVVNDLLVEKFPDLIDIGFTAKMEDELDGIEGSQMGWLDVIREFYAPFSRDMSSALQDMGKVKPKDIPTEEVCDKCGAGMVIKWGRHGRFLACSGYPACKNTRPLEGEAPPKEQVMTEEVCANCGSLMVIKAGRFGKFLACSRYPECKTTKPLATGVKCPLDGGDIVERKTKKGKSFWSCSRYPDCKFAMWQRPVPKPCPKCNAGFLVEKREKTGDVSLICITKDCGYSSDEREQEPSATS